jgi:hypothetical protein
MSLLSLAGCGAPMSPPLPGGGAPLRATITPTPWVTPIPDSAIGAPDAADAAPRRETAPLGSSGVVGPWEVQVHAVWLVPDPARPTDRHGRYAVVDMTGWNRSDRPRPWPFGLQPHTVMVIDSEGVTRGTEPLRLQARHPVVRGLAAARCHAGMEGADDMLRSWESGSDPRMQVPPNMALRTWIALDAGPPAAGGAGVAPPLTLVLRLPPSQTAPAGRLRIVGIAAPITDRPPPAPIVHHAWARLLPAPPVTIGAYRVEALHVAAAGGAAGGAAPPRCLDGRVILRLDLINVDPNPRPVPLPIWLIDDQGWYYRSLVSPRVVLDAGVRERIELEFARPWGRPVGVVIGGGGGGGAVGIPSGDSPAGAGPPPPGETSGTPGAAPRP